MRLITIARFDYPYQAHLAAAQLEASGIPCFLKDEHIVGLNMFYSQAVGGVKLRVPEDKAEEAMIVLSNVAGDEVAEDEEIEDGPRCPACGSAAVVLRRHNGLLLVLSYLLLAFPFSIRQVRYFCTSCKNTWGIDPGGN
jgi:DNA-directed RNA polymerase subunit RPC12/RpoP